MKYTNILKQQLTSLLMVGFTSVLLCFAATNISAQTIPCGVGTKVAYEWSPETVGTIVEIGTTAPHVNWFGIKFAWSNKIEWAAPESNGLLIAGTKKACIAQKPAPPVQDPNKPCGVGTKVAYEWSPETVGTIVEIGTTSPHVNWFGIKFDWSERIQWAAPESNGLLIAGTKKHCTAQKATTTTGTSPAKDPTTTKDKETTGSTCSLDGPPGKVSRTAPASAALFKRVIYEKAAVRANPGSITAPSKIGVTFLKFEMGTPYKNTWTSTRFGDKRLHTGAPLNAMLYPVKTTEVLCEQYTGQVRRTVTEENRTCFKNKDGDWVCPGGVGKTIETKLINQ